MVFVLELVVYVYSEVYNILYLLYVFDCVNNKEEKFYLFVWKDCIIFY